jgi:hypothetical protein
MAANSRALILPNSGDGNLPDQRVNRVGRSGNMQMNHFRLNELTRDVDTLIPRVVRVVRTIRIGLSRSANAWTPLTDTSMTKSKESSFQIAEFAINHPILTMFVLGLIALIGSVCIFAMPAGWLPF